MLEYIYWVFLLSFQVIPSQIAEQKNMRNLGESCTGPDLLKSQKDGCHEDGLFQPRINQVVSSIKNVAI